MHYPHGKSPVEERNAVEKLEKRQPRGGSNNRTIQAWREKLKVVRVPPVSRHKGLTKNRGDDRDEKKGGEFFFARLQLRFHYVASGVTRVPFRNSLRFCSVARYLPSRLSTMKIFVIFSKDVPIFFNVPKKLWKTKFFNFSILKSDHTTRSSRNKVPLSIDLSARVVHELSKKRRAVFCKKYIGRNKGGFDPTTLSILREPNIKKTERKKSKKRRREEGWK